MCNKFLTIFLYQIKGLCRLFIFQTRLTMLISSIQKGFFFYNNKIVEIIFMNNLYVGTVQLTSTIT